MKGGGLDEVRSKGGYTWSCEGASIKLCSGTRAFYQRWFVVGKLMVFSVMVAHVVLVRGGGAEKLMVVGLGNTNWF